MNRPSVLSFSIRSHGFGTGFRGRLGVGSEGLAWPFCGGRRLCCKNHPFSESSKLADYPATQPRFLQDNRDAAKRISTPFSRSKHWYLTTLREKLVEIGAKVVRHGRYVVFQMAEVAIPRRLFATILRRIGRLCPVPV